MPTGKGKKALIAVAAVIGGLFLLVIIAALVSDGGADDESDTGASGDADADAGDQTDTEGSTEPTNQGPTARFTFTCTHLSCDFDGTTSSDPDGNVTTWSWDFGDGNTGDGATVSHTYSNDDTDWMVTLTVTDDEGKTDSISDFPGVVAPPPEPIQFSGSGDKVTAEFTTEQKLLRVTMSHSGSSNFAIWLLNDQGENEDLLVNEIGNYEGSRYFTPPAGDYRLEITGDGSWTVEIEQPRDAGTEPSAKSGNGDTALEGLRFDEGLVVFDMTYQGDSNFAVWVYDADGNTIELAANEIGDYEGQEAVRMPHDGVYYIDVTAHGGTWTIDFS